MAFTPKTWANDAAGATPITAAELNRIEQGVEASMQLDEAQAVTGVKTFADGALLMTSPIAANVEPYSDANPPETLDMTDFPQASVTNPGAGLARVYTPDGVTLRMRDSGGADTLIGPSPGGGGSSAIAGVVANNAVATIETVIATFDVPANFLAAGSFLNLRVFGQVSSTATLAFKVRIGTTGTATDALLTAFATSGAGAANVHTFVDAVVAALTATTATASGVARLSSVNLQPSPVAFAAATVNLAVANKITVTLVQSLVQTHTTRAAVLDKVI